MDQTAHMAMRWMPLLPAVARAVGLLLAAPVPAGSSVPVKVRYFLAVALAVAGLAVAPPSALPASTSALLAALVCELLLGLTIGFAARLVFVGVELAAGQAAGQMGLSLGEAFDPGSGGGGGAVRRLMWVLAVVIFLAVGGHRVVIAALMKTYQAVPPVSALPAGAMLKTAVGLLTVSFQLGLKLAAPVLVAMLLTTVALGLLQRAVPQCNILSFGLPVRAMAGLAVLAASLAVMTGLLATAADLLAGELTGLIEPLGQG